MPDPDDLPTVAPTQLPTRLIGQPRKPAPRTEEEKLDEALADSFPASDPVSFLEPCPPAPREKERNK